MSERDYTEDTEEFYDGGYYKEWGEGYTYEYDPQTDTIYTDDPDYGRDDD